MPDIAKIFAGDERIVTVREYLDGWVAKAYKWPAPGEYRTHYRDGHVETGRYDRKRPRAYGPSWVAMSDKGGRLQSG